MPALNTIGHDTLGRLIALPGLPAIIDLRSSPIDAVPGSLFRSLDNPEALASAVNTGVVTIDAEGDGEAVAAAAILRSDGVVAEALDGGFAAWRDPRHCGCGIGRA